MTAKELIEYLEGFPPEENVCVIALDLETRTARRTAGCQLMLDAGVPVLLFELGDGEPLYDVVEEGAGTDET